MQLRDAQGNLGTVTGLIRHQGFQHMVLDMRASFRKFQVLHTTRRDNDLYFGTAYATGTATVLARPTTWWWTCRPPPRPAPAWPTPRQCRQGPTGQLHQVREPQPDRLGAAPRRHGARPWWPPRARWTSRASG
ncbi:MAG: hypothetical protein WKG07_09850 [Hymenobacter sp.]